MGVPRKQKCVANHDNKPHFFTVIVSPAIQLHKLRLPEKFVRDHGKNLSNFAFLQVPNGEIYRVELLKCKSNVWLHKGWNQFAKNYSIQRGCFLVFRYDGTSHFRVLIFNATALEIDYSRTNLHQIAKQTGQFQLPEVQISKEDEQSGESSKEAANPRNSPLERAKAFQSPNPNFIVHIHKRNLSYNSGPALQTSHCREYFKEQDDNNNIILRVNKKSWDVKSRSEKMRKFCISLAFGWKEFALKNELQEGDVCVFELIHSHPKTYNVHLFRVSDHKKDEELRVDISTATSWRSGRGKKLSRCVPRAVMEKAEAFLRTGPGFIIPMRKSYVSFSRLVHVPLSHSKRYLKNDGDDLNAIVINGKGGKTWRVKYRIEESYPRLGEGWGEFRSDNCLEIGDVCAFKLISRAEKTYKVAIFRGNGN